MRLFELKQEPYVPVLLEGIVHPEDLVFDEGTAGARRAVNSLKQLGQKATPTTIKWDGFPAVIFGRNIDGQLVVADKHMFDKKEGIGRVTSPEAFRQYDINRGADRGDLYGKMDILFPVLEKIIPDNKNTRNKFFWGDLLWAGQLTPQDGFFTFRPNTVTYKVAANSSIGQRIANSVAGIAVHTFIPGIGEPDQPLKGLGGLPSNGPIVFFTGEMTKPAKVKIDADAVAAAEAAINKYDQAVTQFINDLSARKAKGVLAAMKTFITYKISTGNLGNMVRDFYNYLPTKLSAKAQQELLGNGQGWLYTEGRTGVEGIWSIWVAITQLKLSIKTQIDQQQQQGEIQAFTGNDIGGEGYVAGAGAEKIKLVDRLGFSRANFAKNG